MSLGMRPHTISFGVRGVLCAGSTHWNIRYPGITMSIRHTSRQAGDLFFLA